MTDPARPSPPPEPLIVSYLGFEDTCQSILTILKQILSDEPTTTTTTPPSPAFVCPFGIIPPTFFVALHSTDPATRHEACRLLRSVNVQANGWNSTVAALIAETVHAHPPLPADWARLGPARDRRLPIRITQVDLAPGLAPQSWTLRVHHDVVLPADHLASIRTDRPVHGADALACLAVPSWVRGPLPLSPFWRIADPAATAADPHSAHLGLQRHAPAALGRPARVSIARAHRTRQGDGKSRRSCIRGPGISHHAGVLTGTGSRPTPSHAPTCTTRHPPATSPPRRARCRPLVAARARSAQSHRSPCR